MQSARPVLFSVRLPPPDPAAPKSHPLTGCFMSHIGPYCTPPLPPLLSLQPTGLLFSAPTGSLHPSLKHPAVPLGFGMTPTPYKGYGNGWTGKPFYHHDLISLHGMIRFPVPFARTHHLLLSLLGPSAPPLPASDSYLGILEFRTCLRFPSWYFWFFFGHIQSQREPQPRPTRRAKPLLQPDSQHKAFTIRVAWLEPIG